MFTVKVHDMDHSQEETVEELISNTGPGRVEEDDSLETVRFSSGNPRVETTRGVMHLFRNTSVKPGAHGELPAGRTEQLCVLAVPSHMTGADFCQFTGSFFQNIKEMRIVRNDAGKDRYSVIMKFENHDAADDFFKNFNGKPFSSLEAEICHVLFVADVQYTTREHASAAPSGLTELPTCPVCLERLDQHVSGILTTVCNHSFHSSCISKWTDSSCPVCRYCQQKYENSTCSVCSSTENLWICVICGFVGCGRYQEGHAIRHWRETQHCYSLELETQRVWDYVGDNYVHRLIQSKTDGKLVELNAPCHDANADATSCECSRGTEFDEAVMNSKLEAAKYEYDHLLNSQMESQRQYYEGLLAQAQEVRDAAFAQSVEKGVSAKLHKMHEKLEKAEKERAFLEQVNQSLRDNQEQWKEKLRQLEEKQKRSLKERDDKIADLEEQVRDLMVFIEAQRTIESNADMREATVMAMPAETVKPKVGARSGRIGRKNK